MTTTAPGPSFDAARMTRLRSRKNGYLTDTLTNSRFAQPITAASWAAGVATLTTVDHGYSVGQQVLVAGMTPDGYNGTATLTAVTDDTYSYALASNPGPGTAFGTANKVIPCRIALETRDLHFGEVGRLVESKRWRIDQPYGTPVADDDILTCAIRGTYCVLEILSDATLAAGSSALAVQLRLADGTLNLSSNAVVTVTRSRRNPPRPVISMPLRVFIKDLSADIENPDQQSLLFKRQMAWDPDVRYPDDPNSKISQGDTIDLTIQGRTHSMTIGTVRYNLGPMAYAMADINEAQG